MWEQTREQIHWYAASTVVHMLVFAAALLILGAIHFPAPAAPSGFVPVNDDVRVRPPLEPIESFVAPLDTSQLNTDDLNNPQFKVTSQGNAGNDALSDRGGGRQNAAGPDGGGFGGFNVQATGPGPIVRGGGGIGAGHGFGDQPGSGGDGTGFGGRGRKGEMLGKYGGTKNTEMAVIAALNWFARHRNANGSWSLSRFAAHCVGNPCTGPGSAESDVAATSLSLLTFLAAGQTHKSQGPYQPVVNQGIFWLIKHQARNGNLAADSPVAQMYAHALATLTLCECYGMTKDQKVGDAAALAVAFIEAAQNQATGGWRYVPQDPTGGDTSVLGWQVMALHSAQLAGVPVRLTTLDNAKRWLGSVCKGNYRGLYSYQEANEPTPTMTAIGMLSWQYMGMRPDDPAMVEGKQYLLEHLPDNGRRDTYYWYYATQVMHNLMGRDWDVWNHQMRKTLIEAQCHSGCAAGSWDPEFPTLDTWGPQGGRIVTTAFSTLTLEVYYRYLPLYQEGGSASDALAPR
ncbi:MAG TPA: prenyltransferase/squalene oxidase repeat-containing protein [Pirellulales bacterium]|jgi:hypothetical protein|nr:prenyltransferase/squalene oxidase repeat-containing protein [Pirellulales bacterium]